MNLSTSKRKFFFLFFLIFFALGISPARGETSAENSWKGWWEEKTTLDGQILSLVNIQEPTECHENPNNDYLKLENTSYETHLRPNLSFKNGPVKLGFSPRLIAVHKIFEEGGQKGRTDDNVEIFVNEAYIKLDVLPSGSVTVQRKNMQWGNGFLLSPSNPFYSDTGKNRPDQELPGKDFIVLTAVPNDWLSINGLVNVACGEARTEFSEEKFKKVYALKANATFNTLFFSPIISYEDHDRLRLGSYGSWTVSDALILFFDTSFAKGSKARYVVPEAADLFGYEFQRSKDDYPKILPEVLVGSSYTFLNGVSIFLEYLYYGTGYNAAESKRYYRLLEQSADAFPTGSIEALGDLYGSWQNGLAFLRRNYFMLYAKRDNLWQRLDLTSGLMRNMDDNSYYVLNFIDVKINDRLKAFANSYIHSKEDDTEFERPVEFMQTLGLRFYF